MRAPPTAAPPHARHGHEERLASRAVTRDGGAAWRAAAGSRRSAHKERATSSSAVRNTEDLMRVRCPVRAILARSRLAAPARHATTPRGAGDRAHVLPCVYALRYARRPMNPRITTIV